MGQEVLVRVHTETACKIFNSCKRVPNVATVSAMSNTAAFFNFQGHNALDQSHQYITMNFSININDSLAFSNSLDDFAYADVQTCDFQTSEPELHNFTVSIYLFSFPLIVLAIPVMKLAIQTAGSNITLLMCLKVSM